MDGIILYLSPTFGGNTNDIVIARATRHDWYDRFDTQEMGFADSGFRGLDSDGWRLLVTPPRPQNEVDYNFQLRRRFASFRAIVENVIADIKTWDATWMKIRTKISTDVDERRVYDTHNKIWTIAAVLVNRYIRGMTG